MLLSPFHFIIAASSGMDFISASRSLIFPPGSGNGDTFCMNITIVDDSLIEGSERFRVYLNVPYSTSRVGVRLRGRSVIYPTITDNDCT